jgi:hypothetical protein
MDKWSNLFCETIREKDTHWWSEVVTSKQVQEDIESLA